MLRDLAGMVEANLPGTLADHDTEFLHDLRVAVRRSRSVLREMKGAFPPDALARQRDALKWIQAVTGPTRDLDVQLLDWEGLLAGVPPDRHAALAPVRALLGRHRAAALRTLKRELRGPAYRDAWACYRAFLTGEARPARRAARRRAARSSDVAGERIRKVYGPHGGDGRGDRRRQPGRRPPRAAQAGQGAALPARAVRRAVARRRWSSPWSRRSRACRTCSGTHQDREVQADHLRGLADELAGQVGGPEALLALGVLVDRLEAEQHDARDHFAERFAAFASPRPAEARGEDVRVVKVVATYNIKGGVGKTSAAVNLAALAAADGLRTLLWDLDPQGAASFLFRVRPKVRGGGRKLVRGRSDVTDLLRGTDVEGLDLLPADFSYRHMDLALDETGKPTRRLRKVLAPLAEHYDLAVLDCPPSISLVSESVFDAADALLVPLIPSTLTLRTFEQLGEFVDAEVDRPPEIVAFFSMVDRRKRLHRQVVESLPRGPRRRRPRPPSRPPPRSSSWASSASPVVVAAPRSRGARAYAAAVGRGARPPRRLTRSRRVTPGGACARAGRWWTGPSARRGRGWPSSCSTAGRSAGGRPRTRGRGASRSGRTAPRCAPCRGPCRVTSVTRSPARGSQKLGQPLPESNLVSDENSAWPQATQR